MHDMLVKLFNLPDLEPLIAKMFRSGIIVRRPNIDEKDSLVIWVTKNFGNLWISECEKSFINQPVSCFIAEINHVIVGFACYDVKSKNLFGPTGVLTEYRNNGVGAALLVSSLNSMKEVGYSYAIIGGVGPVDFYKKTVDASIIEGSYYQTQNRNH